jgi:hypothetical protein
VNCAPCWTTSNSSALSAQVRAPGRMNGIAPPQARSSCQRFARRLSFGLRSTPRRLSFGRCRCFPKLAPKQVFLNFGEPYPNHDFTAVVLPADQKNFGDLKGLDGKSVRVTGKIEDYRGKPEMTLTS